MKRIINGKMYDTDKATEIHVDTYRNRALYQTDKGTYFMRYANNEIKIKSEAEVRDYLSRYDVDKYIELFGEVEEG